MVFNLKKKIPKTLGQELGSITKHVQTQKSQQWKNAEQRLFEI